MVVRCFVKGCNSTALKTKSRENDVPVSFFGISKDSNLNALWIKVLVEGNNQTDLHILPKTAKVCCRHFDIESFEKHRFMPLRLKRNAIPSIFPNGTKNSDIDSKHSSGESIQPDIPICTTLYYFDNFTEDQVCEISLEEEQHRINNYKDAEELQNALCHLIKNSEKDDTIS